MQATPTVQDESDHRGQLADSVRLLRSVRRTLTDLLERADEPGVPRDVAAKAAELESALRRAWEAEERWNDWQARHGRAREGGPEIDFERVRDEIACRLERLRDCCQE